MLRLRGRGVDPEAAGCSSLSSFAFSCRVRRLALTGKQAHPVVILLLSFPLPPNSAAATAAATALLASEEDDLVQRSSNPGSPTKRQVSAAHVAPLAMRRLVGEGARGTRSTELRLHTHTRTRTSGWREAPEAVGRYSGGDGSSKRRDVGHGKHPPWCVLRSVFCVLC
jgi:hypothetical protein